MNLIKKLRSKYPELKEEPMIDELEMMVEGEEEEEMPEEDMDMEMDMEEELPEDEGEEEMLESYEDDDMDMLEDEEEMASPPELSGERSNKKDEHQRRMRLRKALKGM